ncbi:MAG: MaoC family dehydratase [Rhodospirillaceae bacterium]|nr:MaoC family dehydratase [Rhodospirillaceae bacterium]
MTAPDSPDTLYFDDFAPGMVFEWGGITVSEESIVAFGREFDPVAIHTDPAAAARGEFGGLIASGWQLAALMQRMQYESYIRRSALIASPGVDGLDFLRPVRPGDRLSLRVEVVECRRSRKRADRGLVRVLAHLVNQDGETVLEKRGKSYFRARPAGNGSTGNGSGGA